MVDALTLAGQRAAAEMERLWRLDVIDPPLGSKDPRAPHSLDEITRIIKRNGWAWSLPTGRYEHNGSPQWCGMTAGDAWATAGLDPVWLATWFASTDRLVAWGRYERWNDKRNLRPTNGDLRVCVPLVPGKAPTVEPRPGDIVIVGNGKRSAGQHVTVCMAYDAAARRFDTISGNGGGVGPNGDRREGISRASFAIDPGGGYRAMWLGRPAFGDLVAERL